MNLFDVSVVIKICPTNKNETTAHEINIDCTDWGENKEGLQKTDSTYFGIINKIWTGVLSINIQSKISPN